MVFSALTEDGQRQMIGIQNPIKDILNRMKGLPEPVKTGEMDANTHILIDVTDEFFGRLHLPGYARVFRPVFNFIIHKYHADKNYRDWLDWSIGRLIQEGWIFPRLDTPPSPLWDNPMPEKRARLLADLKSHYDVLQSIAEDETALGQFFDRVLTSVDEQVLLWKQ